MKKILAVLFLTGVLHIDNSYALSCSEFNKEDIKNFISSRENSSAIIVIGEIVKMEVMENAYVNKKILGLEPPYKTELRIHKIIKLPKGQELRKNIELIYERSPMDNLPVIHKRALLLISRDKLNEPYYFSYCSFKLLTPQLENTLNKVIKGE